MQTAVADVGRTLRRMDGSLRISTIDHTPTAADCATAALALKDWLRILTKDVEVAIEHVERRFHAKLRSAKRKETKR